MSEARGLKRGLCARLLCCLMALALLTCALPARAEEGEPFPPTQPEAIADLIEEAMGVYAWFTIWPLGGDLEQPMQEGVSEYYLVLDDRYNTRLELAGFALEYFSMEIVTRLFDRGLYREQDGLLYVSDRFSIMDENISYAAYHLTEEGEDFAAYQATVHYLEGTDEEYTRTYDYRLERTEEGQWVFTQFAFYWEGEWSNLDG